MCSSEAGCGSGGVYWKVCASQKWAVGHVVEGDTGKSVLWQQKEMLPECWAGKKAVCRQPPQACSTSFSWHYVHLSGHSHSSTLPKEML